MNTHNIGFYGECRFQSSSNIIKYAFILGLIRIQYKLVIMKYDVHIANIYRAKSQDLTMKSSHKKQLARGLKCRI